MVRRRGVEVEGGGGVEASLPANTEGDLEGKFLVVVQEVLVDVLDGAPAGVHVTLGSLTVAAHDLQVAEGETTPILKERSTH